MAARSRVWPDPRVKPPPGAAYLDWHHPLSDALAFCLPFLERGGSISQDVARGISVRSVNGSTGDTQFTWETSARGIGPYVADAGPNHLIRFGADLTMPANASFSDFFLVDLVSFGTGNPGWWRTTNLSNAHLFQATNFRVQVRVGGGAVLNPGSGTAMSTGMHAESVVNVNASSAKEYLDGVLVQQASHATATASGVINWIGSQANLNGTEKMEGRYLAAYMWFRALSAAEIQWVHTEPFAMFKPIVQRRYFVPDATPAVSTIPFPLFATL